MLNHFGIYRQHILLLFLQNVFAAVVIETFAEFRRLNFEEMSESKGETADLDKNQVSFHIKILKKMKYTISSIKMSQLPSYGITALQWNNEKQCLVSSIRINLKLLLDEMDSLCGLM